MAAAQFLRRRLSYIRPPDCTCMCPFATLFIFCAAFVIFLILTREPIYNIIKAEECKYVVCQTMSCRG